MTMLPCHILAVFVGESKTLVDERGTWRSSIARDQMAHSIQLETTGFHGDRATQPYHGSPELAVCIHAQPHYTFWNTIFGLQLQPGAVGENLTFDTWEDRDVCVGDVFQIGTARIQISAPRTPCENQARHIGRADWVKQTIQELRTGMYARVLEPGMVTAGDRVLLEARPNPTLTIYSLNKHFYQAYDPVLTEQFLVAEGLMDWWKQRLRNKAEKHIPDSSGLP